MLDIPYSIWPSFGCLPTSCHWLTTPVLFFASLLFIIYFRYSCLRRRAPPITLNYDLTDMATAEKIQKAKDFGELCRISGYTHEDHFVTTEDGYILGLHRLHLKKNEQPSSVTTKPVVYMHHGLLTNSELFVCLTDEQRCIPFVLVENGYDVWLGNNRQAYFCDVTWRLLMFVFYRGNKYSQQHNEYRANSSKFWVGDIHDLRVFDISIPQHTHLPLRIFQSTILLDVTYLIPSSSF